MRTRSSFAGGLPAGALGKRNAGRSVRRWLVVGGAFVLAAVLAQVPGKLESFRGESGVT